MTLEQFKSDVVVHYRTMYSVALALLRQPDDASDAVQDAMAQLWDHRDLLDRVTNLRAYCSGTVRNECLARLRRAELVRPFAEGEEERSTIEADADVVESRDELNRVNAFIDSLPEVSRRILRMNAWGGCSGREIAEATGVSEANVRTILSRTRKQLRTLFPR